jgi:fluoroquinolone transport system permease protein
MRLFRLFLTDVRYQFKYGFYFLYLLFSVFYIAVLLMVPGTVRREVAALIIWSDPAALGFFFIGGIVLLEKGEGLHSYLSILPVTTREFVLAKVLSLSLISLLAGLAIAAAGLAGQVNYVILTVAVLAGAGIFTLFGLSVGVAARSVNHYMVIGVPVGLLLMGPSVIILFGLSHPLVEILPSTLLLRLLYGAVGLEMPYSASIAVAGLLLWLLPAFWLAHRRFAGYIQQRGVT